MGDDSIEEDQIVNKGNGAAPADYIDGMLAAGWSPCLSIGEDGSTTLFEGYPELAGTAALEQGHKVSAWWMATPERRAQVKASLRRRGLVRAG